MFHSSYAAALIWTAVVYQLMVISNAQNNAPGYLGCFKDGNSLFTSRSLRGESTTSGSLSVEWCFNYCLNNNAYKYAGVESETECYCGDNEDYDRRGKVADSECRDTCPGNTDQYCGGHWRIAVYQISNGVCNNAIGPPVHGSHYVTNPAHVSFNLDNSKFFGTRVRFECGTGYIIQGAETIECTQMGNIADWSNSVPTCIVVPLTTISYTAPSLLPTTMNQTNNTSMVTNSTNVTTSSGVPSSIPDTTIPDTTDRPEMSDPQTIQTGKKEEDRAQMVPMVRSTSYKLTSLQRQCTRFQAVQVQLTKSHRNMTSLQNQRTKPLALQVQLIPIRKNLTSLPA